MYKFLLEWLYSNRGVDEKMQMGKKIKALRIARNMTQKQLALKLGVTPSVVSAYENDSRQPSYTVLFYLCKTLHVNSDFLLGLEKQENFLPFTELSESQVKVISDLIQEFIKTNQKAK